MDSVKFDTFEARCFAEWLAAEGTKLAQSKESLNRLVVELNQAWDDKKYMEYLAMTSECLLALHVFLLEADRFSHYLRDRANRVEAYLE